LKLDNKVCVVTGGANGIGQATVEKFLAEGAKVVIADFNDELGQHVCSRLKDNGYSKEVEFLKTDVRIESEIENLVNNTCKMFGRSRRYL
jgi:Dehydrogenases with different specificities (related to short-chain alcohol dehydrogenases)